MNESNSNEYITENDVFSSCCTSSWHYKTKIIVFLSTLQHSTTCESNYDTNRRNHKNYSYHLRRFLKRKRPKKLLRASPTFQFWHAARVCLISLSPVSQKVLFNTASVMKASLINQEYM